jgi:multicomponent Na+:H+ antiporter subunit E
MFIRFTAFLVFWLVLDGGKPFGLVIGLPAVALVTWISLRLLPPGGQSLRWGAVVSLGGHFLWDSIVAGLDVARRVFDPRLPLRTGFVTCECKLPAGPRRDFFLAMSSLMPGSLPVEEGADGSVVLHCLDTDQPQAALLAANEKKLRKLWRDGSDA